MSRARQIHTQPITVSERTLKIKALTFSLILLTSGVIAKQMNFSRK